MTATQAHLLHEYTGRCYRDYLSLGEGYGYYSDERIQGLDLGHLQGLAIGAGLIGLTCHDLRLASVSALKAARRDDSTVPLAVFPHENLVNYRGPEGVAGAQGGAGEESTVRALRIARGALGWATRLQAGRRWSGAAQARVAGRLYRQALQVASVIHGEA